jgi:hypothetical protein
LGEETTIEAVKLGGVHVCPQGEARGAPHLIKRLLKLFDHLGTSDALGLREFPEVFKDCAFDVFSHCEGNGTTKVLDMQVGVF